MPQITPKDPKLSSSVMEKKKKETATIITAAAAAAATTTKPTAVRAVSHRRRRPQAAEQPPASLTIAVFVCWIVPVLLIAILTRFRVDDDGSSSSAFPAKHSKPVALNINMAQNSHMDDNNNNNKSSPPIPAASKTSQPSKYSSNKAPTEMPTILKNKPTGYQEVVKEIEKRRLDWTSTSSGTMGGYKAQQQQQQEQKPKSTTAPTTATKTQGPPPQKTQQSRGASSDPVRMQLADQINELRKDFKNQPNDIYRAANLADALRMYDVQYHDGGTYQNEAIETYQRAIGMAMEKRQTLIDQGEETSRSLTGTTNVNEETFLDYSARSVDGLLCALYTSLGKTYFMANMFEKAVESYNGALEIDSLYLDAISSRGSSRIILGKYQEAAQDFMTVMKNDTKKRYQDVYTGLARVLQARESAVPEGWTPMIQNLEEMIPLLESQADLMEHPEGKTMLANTLNRFYHVMFLYHDVKTKDTDAAWENLKRSYFHKMSALPDWSAGFESQKISATKQIFQRGFWPKDVGSESKLPVFIIGFVRSGSTLLERVLDAHPQIVGTGENSVFNGQLDHIRNRIVETSMLGDTNELKKVIKLLADDVVDEMRNRQKMVAAGENRAADGEEPLRYVDKMLTNYYNVGFIHMLFPNALILHVAREPMDTIFSAYKHEFPSGTLDYTSDFPSLAELYHGYRDLMDHWDRELPGRVTHIRYEDMVNDMPGVARKIIEATGLDWDDGVLDFHKKKQAVNTLSTTQVRKGVYRDSLQAWRRYETHLAPLVEMIGERTTCDLKTTLAGYEPPTMLDSGGDE